MTNDRRPESGLEDFVSVRGLTWNSGNLPVGIYFAELEAGGARISKKIALVH